MILRRSLRRKPRWYKGLGLVALALLFLAGWPGIGSGKPHLKAEPVRRGPGWHKAPVVHGDLVAWRDDTDENWNVRVYNLASGRETWSTTDPADQVAPAVYGRKVVWEDRRNGNADLYLFDANTGEETRLTDGPEDETSPAIHGNLVAWNSQGYVYLRDLATAETRRLTSSPGGRGRIRMSDRLVVWEEYRNANWDIYAYDLLQGREVQLTDDPAGQVAPAVSGTRVVWIDGRWGGSEVVVYDYATGELKRLTRDRALQARPAINGDLVVWQDDRNGDWDIYLYNLRTGGEFQVSSSSSHEGEPAIAGDLVVWAEYRHDQYYKADLWMTRLPPPPSRPARPEVDGTGLPGELQVRWAANPEKNLAGYNLYRDTDPAGKKKVKVNVGLLQATEFLDTGLQDGKWYYYWAEAVNQFGQASPLSEAGAGVPEDTPPAAPTGLTVEDLYTGTDLRLKWKANRERDVVGYNLYRRELVIEPYTRPDSGGIPGGVYGSVYGTIYNSVYNTVYGIIYSVYGGGGGGGTSTTAPVKINSGLVNGTSFVDENLTRGQIYYYYVTAVDRAGHESLPSDTVSGMPTLIPVVP